LEPSGGVWKQNVIASEGGIAFGTQGGNIIIHGTAGQVRDQAMTAGSDGRVRILLMAANPVATGRLTLDEEAREIEEKLRLSRGRDRFDLITRWAVRPDDLLRHLNEIRPHIVHFSGHGSPNGEIVLSGGEGAGHRVAPAALAEVFRVMGRDIRVVMLNACYSDIQAQALGTSIDYVVGMSAAVGDKTATVFAAGFYSAIGYHRPVLEAFEQAVAAVMVHGLPGHNIPRLLVRDGADPMLTTEP
jgi:hypothetical protein